VLAVTHKNEGCASTVRTRKAKRKTGHGDWLYRPSSSWTKVHVSLLCAMELPCWEAARRPNHSIAAIDCRIISLEIFLTLSQESQWDSSWKIVLDCGGKCRKRISEASTVYNFDTIDVDGNPEVQFKSLKRLVGERGFEPPTPWSRTRCSTRLSHSPTRLREATGKPSAPRSSTSRQALRL
jgi:hypothetical protein